MRKQSRRDDRKMRLFGILAAAATASVIVLLFVQSRQLTGGQTNAVTVENRDIIVTHSFTGQIEPGSTQEITTAVTGVKISKVFVKAGDTVTEGQVIAELDASSLESQISEKEAEIETAKKTGQASVDAAQSQYEQQKANLSSGNDQTVQSAQTQVSSSAAALETARQSYRDEVQLYSSGQVQSIVQAEAAVTSAKADLDAASLALEQAVDAKNNVEQEAQNGLSESVTAEDGTAAAGTSTDILALEQKVQSAQLSVNSAQSIYDAAVKSLDAAKAAEENKISEMAANINELVTSYNNAVSSEAAAQNKAAQQLDTYSDQVEQAKAGADTSVSEQQLETLKKQLDDYTLKAPIGGYVSALNMKEGDITGIGTYGSLATIIEEDNMHITIRVGEYDIASVKTGDSVDIRIDALGKKYTGAIEKIDHNASTEDGVSYYEVAVSFEGDSSVKSGMSAEVSLKTEDLKSVPSLPNEAILTAEDGSSYVLQASGNGSGTVKTAVETGATDGTYTQILSGLKAGDSVCTDKNSNDYSVEEIESQMNAITSGNGGTSSGTQSGE